ncbi:filament-like plant protein 7 [Coffea eugenioides]|uniref:filament-like plant protein 7 n=1 Tax=Coffea eugenioides TaxID=49369 RepID=UPI000F605C50|nr:filament-like plant protein 7 [Coffea eugenioides]
MDHKSWLWKRRSTEKTIISDDKTNLSLSRGEEETLLSDKAQLELDLKILNHKLSSAISECNNKDDFAKQQAKIAQEAIAGWEKTETEALSLKQELEKALQQRSVSEERLLHLDAALKECMLQLRFVREEQEKRIHDAVMKTSKEFESTRFVLDQKLVEANKRLAKVDGENGQLSKALLAKEKVIEELHKHTTQMEVDFSSLVTRLESTEKENVSLKYEVRVLEKELEIRNEEREFNRRTAEVAHKQHLESVKKIAKLESECQSLRILVRKRLPGPAALAKMKNEVEMLGRNQAETRRRKSNPSPVSPMDISADMASDTLRQRISFLTEQLCFMEEENRTLKEALNKRLSELESPEQLEGHETAEPEKNKRYLHTFSVASMSDMGSDDKTSCTESSASAFILELEQLRSGKQMGTPSSRTVGASDMSLMDDFVEMEKLAVVSADDPPGASNRLAENDATQSPLRTQPNGAMIPVCHLSNLSVPSHQILSQNVSPNKAHILFESIIQIVLEQSQVLKRKPNEILDEIKAGLPQFCHPNFQLTDKKESSNQDDALCVTKDMSERSSNVLEEDSSDKGTCNTTATKSSQKVQLNLNKSLHKIIELIEGISIPPLDNGNTEVLSRNYDNLLHFKDTETPTGYIGRVFQWKASELSTTLKQFVQTCSDLLNGKSGLETFAEQLACTLEWIMNHCFSLQDVSSMKDAIRSYFDWDESRSESEADSGATNHVSESNKLNIQNGEKCTLPLVSASNDEHSHFQVEEVLPNFRKEFRRLKDELPNKESAENDFEGRLQLEAIKNESLINQLQESNKTSKTLQVEVESPKPMKEKTSHQNQKHKQVKEALERQLMETKNELKEACENLMYTEKELPNQKSSCQKLNGTYDDQELPMESMVEKGTVDGIANHGRELRTDWEIVAASEKLAECQETILNLGKQLKALASPMEAALFDKVVSSPSNPVVATMTTPKKNTRQRSSLLDKMLAEDKYETEDLKSPKTKEIILEGNSYSVFGPNWTIEPPEKVASSNGVNYSNNEAEIGSLAIVPSKKRGSGGLLKKLLRRGRNGSCKKIVS